MWASFTGMELSRILTQHSACIPDFIVSKSYCDKFRLFGRGRHSPAWSCRGFWLKTVRAFVPNMPPHKLHLTAGGRSALTSCACSEKAFRPSGGPRRPRPSLQRRQSAACAASIIITTPRRADVSRFQRIRNVTPPILSPVQGKILRPSRSSWRPWPSY